MAGCRIEVCDRGAVAKGMCLMHYKRQWRGGDPAIKPERAYPGLRERLMARVAVGNEDDPCWVWTGATDDKGYGKIQRGANSGVEAVHRISWKLNCGPIPDGMCVLHHCDNPPCVNPSHLFIGSIADNNLDMRRKGRGKNPAPRRGKRPDWECVRGESHPMAKLTDDSVSVIKAEVERIGRGGRVLMAQRFGVSATTIGRIVSGKNWKEA